MDDPFPVVIQNKLKTIEPHESIHCVENAIARIHAAAGIIAEDAAFLYPRERFIERSREKKIYPAEFQECKNIPQPGRVSDVKPVIFLGTHPC